MKPSILLSAASCLLLSCSEAPSPSKTALSPVPSASSPPPRPSLSLGATTSAPSASQAAAPAALPASAKGIGGELLRVEEKDGFRWLLIDDVVHAAVRVDKMEDPLMDRDPVASIFGAVQDRKAEVLAIGLGSGQTISLLRDIGRKVDAVELEPVVIDFARKYFNFQGDVKLGDGAVYLKNNKKIYDSILLDAFAGKELPKAFLEDDTLKALRASVKRDGVVCVRMMGRPSEPRIFQAISAFASYFPSMRLLGTGVGDSEQHLYLLLMQRPQSFRDLDVHSLWPIPLPDAKTLSSNSGQEALRKAVLNQRPPRVRLAGYLVRNDKDPKQWLLHLPHWEMGSRHYVLKFLDADAKKLQLLLPPKTKFPSAGDMSTDGDLKPTLLSLLGGGGVKLSLVRFSPVVVAVEGLLLPASGEAPPSLPTRHAFEKPIPILPRGVISVEKLHWSIDLPAFKRFRASKVGPRARSIEASVRRMDFVGAGKEASLLEGDLALLFGAFWPRLGFAEEFMAIREVLAFWGKALSPASSALEKAKVCDWAAFDLQSNLALDHLGAEDEKKREVFGVLRALQNCAEENYLIVLKDKSLDSKIVEVAAGRMVSLLETKLFELDYPNAGRKALEMTLEAMKGRAKDGKALEEPPPF